MHTCVRTPRPNTPTRIGGKTPSEHAKEEKRRVKREPRKYVKCHAAHTGRTTNKGGQRGMWSRVECKWDINLRQTTHAKIRRSKHNTVKIGEGGTRTRHK